MDGLIRQIMKIRQTIRRAISGYTFYQKSFKPSIAVNQMGSLPPLQVEEGEPFEAVGVDLFGAFQVNPAEPDRAMARHISVSEMFRGTFQNRFLICRYRERVEKWKSGIVPRSRVARAHSLASFEKN